MMNPFVQISGYVNRTIGYIGIHEERDYFIENVSTLLSSGTPILEAIDAVNSEIHSKRLIRIFNTLALDIDAGYSLSAALERTNLFSPHVASLIRIGEKTGRLAENLKVIAVQQKKERDLRSKLKSAAMYPLFVLGITLIVGIGISWFILPKLALIFGQLKIALPFVTHVLIKIGGFLGLYGIYVVPASVVSVIILLFFIFSWSKTRIIGEYILFILPGVKRLMKESEIARLGYLFGSLLAAGLPPTEALHSMSQATPTKRYKKLYLYLEQSMVDGFSFKSSFAQFPTVHALLPVTVQQLIIAGERSGTLSRSFLTIGEEYEMKTERSSKDLAVILEPILLVCVWLGVVGVALAVVLPIYSLIGGLDSNMSV